MATKTKKKASETPLMKQYYSIKEKHPETILLFRIGDFYETFENDAVLSSEILGIVLTKRANGAASYVDLAGFPHHSLQTYLPKLVKAGHRVAICEQLEDPKLTKSIVKRGVTELVTPGVSFNDNVLEQKSNNFLAALHFGKKNNHGIAFLDVSTGEFLLAEGGIEYIEKLIQSLAPKEILYQRSNKNKFNQVFSQDLYSFQLDDWAFSKDFATETLTTHFNTTSLKGFGIHSLENGTIAAGAALQYLKDTRHDKVGHITSISRIQEDRFVWMDKFTMRNLELFYSPNSESTTLLQTIDQTTSPMGGRLIKRWLALPLKNKTEIEERHNVVEYFISNLDTAESIKENTYKIGDLERLISKVAVGRINPREIVQLKNALIATEPIKDRCLDSNQKALVRIGKKIDPCAEVIEKIDNEIQNEAPVLVNKGNVISDGVSKELDELRKIAFSGKDYLIKIKERESARTEIASLKIGFNNVFGYYIEVTNSHKDKVPEDWIRKQTLVNAERYITQELKEYEQKILGAEEKILELESNLYEQLVLSLGSYIEKIQQNAHQIGKLDCLLTFAQNARQNNYVKPELNDGKSINIINGRHPVIEQLLPADEEYVPNSILLDDKTQQIMIITGPNMSGKSALLRQTALITILAQMGSYVPAEKAEIGLVDKIFTRVGASDNLSMGESTFMVEMNETASILNNLSDNSLVLLDEIGRGTSTYDGVSIAWSIAEFIHENKKAKAKTLFATHYHEMNDLADSFKRIKNWSVSIKETNNKIIFLRKLIPQGSEHSFGIHVAKMAGMPKAVIERANEIMELLEKKNKKNKSKTQAPGDQEHIYQLSMFEPLNPNMAKIEESLSNLKLNEMTPIDALILLSELQKKLKN